jgi:hypothetical protein
MALVVSVCILLSRLLALLTTTGKVTEMLCKAEAAERGIPSIGESVGPEMAKYPAVAFIQNPHASHPIPGLVWIPQQSFSLENPNGTTRATRQQVPLILAWWVSIRPAYDGALIGRAMSMHKSQGQTLERVKIDASSVFTHGACYIVSVGVTSADTCRRPNVRGHFTRDVVEEPGAARIRGKAVSTAVQVGRGLPRLIQDVFSVQAHPTVLQWSRQHGL